MHLHVCTLKHSELRTFLVSGQEKRRWSSWRRSWLVSAINNNHCETGKASANYDGQHKQQQPFICCSHYVLAECRTRCMGLNPSQGNLAAASQWLLIPLKTRENKLPVRGGCHGTGELTQRSEGSRHCFQSEPLIIFQFLFSLFIHVCVAVRNRQEESH